MSLLPSLLMELREMLYFSQLIAMSPALTSQWDLPTRNEFFACAQLELAWVMPLLVRA